MKANSVDIYPSMGVGGGAIHMHTRAPPPQHGRFSSFGRRFCFILANQVPTPTPTPVPTKGHPRRAKTFEIISLES